MPEKQLQKKLSLFIFSLSVSFITYGFALTNFTLTIDSESPIYPDYSMGLGRWGTNLIRHKLCDGLLPYFTLLFGLVFLSLTAIEIVKIFKIKGLYGYIFCLLFLTLPQHSYQLAFTMQADAVPIGFFCGVIAVGLFINNINSKKRITLRIFALIFSLLLVTFTISIYQALVFIPVIVYLIYFFVISFEKEFQVKKEIINLIYFAILMAISGVLYYISVKLFCPPIESGYLSTYASGNSSNRLIDFYNLCVDNIRGDFYYGDKTYLLSSLAFIFLMIFIIKEKKNVFIKISSLLVILITPFVISFFITNGSHPPRLYVASSIVFGFVIVKLFQILPHKYLQQFMFITILISLTNIFYVTNLFYSSNKIFNHDLNIARNINNTIENKFSDFNPNLNYVYFYGALPSSNHDKIKIPNSDVFGGSLFNWDGGNNWRIINFFRVNDIAYYKFLDNKESFDQVKDSIQSMPIWPNKEAVKKFDNVVVVKIGDTPGAPLPFQ
jgi:hypothetical protein